MQNNNETKTANYSDLSERTRFQIELLPRLNKKFPRATLAEKLKICQELYEDGHRSAKKQMI